MISVSGKDWRSRSVLGSEMEESELEEGEAFSYHQGNNDSAIGPDINALSYIEEKLQSVLGHFQKDFEGGVSVENLGAKYGGYGSFLPSHQRSPRVVQSSERSPKKPNSVASVSASPLVRASAEKRGKLRSGNADKLSMKSVSNEKPVNNLKLRIKVGSENLLTQKNVDIYNGLGLVSPSSSVDGSPNTSGAQYVNVLPDQSPTSILQIMTSFPGHVLLSPLSEDLIQLNKSFGGNHEGRKIGSTENSVMPINGFHSIKSNEKAREAKKLKSFVAELADQTNRIVDKTVLPLKKGYETDDDAVICEEIVSNALKLPLLSSSEYGSTDPGREMHAGTTVPAHSMKDGISGETLSSSIPGRDNGRVGNSGSSLGSSCNVSDYEKRNCLSTNVAGSGIVKQMADVSHTLDQSEFSGSKVKKTRRSAESSYLSKQFVFQNGGSVRAEDVKPSFDSPSNGHVKKEKVAQGGYTRKDEPAVGSSMAHKHEKLSGSHELKKENEKASDRYKDFFGDEAFDDDDDDENESLSGELTSGGRFKNQHPYGKTSFNKDHSMPKSKSSENPQFKEKYIGSSSHAATPVVNGTSTNAPTGLQPMVNEHWVSCDLCQIWRLLPLGTDPKSLPDKWTCSMLTWLPGMNRCHIPEEITTNALRAFYQPAVTVPATISEGKNIGFGAGYSDQEHQSFAVKSATNIGKKKSGSLNATKSNEVDGSTRSSSSRKYNLGKGSNLSGGTISHSTDAGRYQLPGRSSSGTEKLENGKRKMSLVSCSDRGAQLSVKSKQEADADGPKRSKRVKSEEFQFDDERLMANNFGSPLKGGNSSTSFSNNTSEKDHRKQRNRNDFSAVDKKNSVSDLNVETDPPRAANNASVHYGKHDENDNFRKRKAKEHHPETHSEKRVRVSISTKGSNMEAEQKSEGPKHGLYAEKNLVSDYLKSDLCPLQPSLAANSSSSKVSGSHKNKMGGQEVVKGSPVESVSSSPLRHHDADKTSSKVRNLVGNFDIEDCKSLNAVSRRKLSVDGESNGQAEIQKTSKNSFDQRKVEGRTNNGTSGCDMENLSSRALDCLDQRQLYDEKPKSRRNKSDEKSGTTSKGEKSSSRKETARGTPDENGKAHDVRRFTDNGQDAIKSMDKRHDIREHDAEKFSQKSNVLGNVKSHSLPPLAKASVETAACLEPVSGCNKDKGVKVEAADAIGSSNVHKTQAQKVKGEHSNGPPFRLSTPNAHKVRDTDAPSPVRRESSSHAANSAPKEAKDLIHAANSALKEATNLKHTADRMKNAGSHEGIGLYFEACLKFLLGASLLESGASGSSKHNELMRSLHTYRSTANLCEYCAHEYEKSKDMASAALAYKCVEVAYMRVVYSSHPSANRDRNELQSALQLAAPGESPSSSASDVDNLNHQASAPDKGTLSRVGDSPHVSGSHEISSRNRAGFLRVLNFAQDVSFAMEASRKSRLAFTAAISTFSETSNEESVSSLKKALDYAFQDVTGFLRLVRVAMEAISR